MFGRILLCVFSVCVLAGGLLGGDLYSVRIQSNQEAQLLTDAGVEALVRLGNTYLILADPERVDDLAAKGIKPVFIYRNINRNELAIDARLDRAQVDKYEMVYTEDNFRLFRINPGSINLGGESSALMPVPETPIPILYSEPEVYKSLSTERVNGLQELIDQVSQDSLQSYTEALQAFGSRYTGTASNYASRDWIAGKFVEFGYDSIVIDSFTYSTSNCMNVIAYKIGDYLPDHHIIVGAHRDAVSGSPGADDNGSGTAGVLEFARILADYSTDVSFVFILFDAEEQGLHGSYHYAEDAYARGDSIIYMLNMDMIAYYTNTSSAKLYHGTDISYSQLWQDMADSLVGVTGILSGSSGGSDHYPFTQYGYKATFVHEYIFSTVYHSYRDSTSYMSFDYMTKMVKASLATTYVAAQTYIPGPSLAFDYPGGIPQMLDPDQPTSFDVTVSGFYGGEPVPGTGQIHYSVNDGPWQSDDMLHITGNQYIATIPPLSCNEYVKYYVSAEEISEGIIFDPDPSQPRIAFPATSDSIIFADDFEIDRGWTVSGGLWERGSPTGGGGEYGNPDPVEGYKSPNCFGYNLYGDYTNSMPEYHLTSPAIDCSGLFGVRLSFRRWLGVEQPSYDHAYIRISGDGAAWTTIWENTAEVTDDQWLLQEFDLSTIADNQETVYLRWTMGTTDGGWVYCGWNIDDVIVRAYICDNGPAPLQITTETIPDWTAGYPMAEQLTATGGTGNRTWLDKDNDLVGTGLSLSTDGVLSGSPDEPGTVGFTARVEDENEDFDEYAYQFTVNSALVIVTVDLPDGIISEPYAAQLEATGGTGALTWTDSDDGLSETGLSLAGDGAIAGTPAAVGDIYFTARITDAVGSFTDTPLHIQINLPVICGNVNGDDAVNVADAVFLINYVFKGGPEPDPVCGGDANGDDETNVADAVYSISYVFKGGPPPVDNCCL